MYVYTYACFMDQSIAFERMRPIHVLTMISVVCTCCLRMYLFLCGLHSNFLPTRVRCLGSYSCWCVDVGQYASRSGVFLCASFISFLVALCFSTLTNNVKGTVGWDITTKGWLGIFLRYDTTIRLRRFHLLVRRV